MGKKAVGVIGCGLMGTAISQRLLSAGFELRVWNRTKQKAGLLIQQGARWSDNPIACSDRVILSLYSSNVVKAVLERFSSGLRPGLCIIDTTTGDPEHSEALERKLKEQGVSYLEAPVSGSSEQTRRGEVTVLVGGPEEAFSRCRDLFEAFARKVLHVGPCGTGAKMKLVSNLVLGLNRAALAEGLAYAEALALDPRLTLTVLTESMAYSRIMDTKGRKMVAEDFTAQAKLSQHLKDVLLILESAKKRGLPLPLTEAHRLLLEEAQRAGYGEADNSAVVTAYKRLKQRKP